MQAKNFGIIGKILITAGPTRESLDPIRYISNRSTGTMGYEIAKESIEKGFDVCLISGPVHIPPVDGAEIVNVETARDMMDRVRERLNGYDCLVMTAAVCDFRPEKQQTKKIKKQETLMIKLVKNPDILMETFAQRGIIRVGFALETENPIENGKKKLKEKKMDLVVINSKDPQRDPFGEGPKDYTTIDAKDNIKTFEKVTKRQIAGHIINEVQRLIDQRR